MLGLGLAGAGFPPYRTTANSIARLPEQDERGSRGDAGQNSGRSVALRRLQLIANLLRRNGGYRRLLFP